MRRSWYAIMMFILSELILRTVNVDVVFDTSSTPFLQLVRTVLTLCEDKENRNFDFFAVDIALFWSWLNFLA